MMDEELDKTNDERKPLMALCKNKLPLFTPKEILFILAILLLEIGIEFGYDIPGALQVTMMKYYDLSYYQYSLFYSLYSIPNIFHSFVGGYLIDRVFGIKIGTVIYICVALFGMVIFAFGAQLKTFTIMLFGRLVYGVGAEMSGTVCLNYFIYSWFEDSYVNLVYSLSDNMGYVGTLLAYSTGQSMYEGLTKDYSNKGALDLTLSITSVLFLIPFAGGLTMALLKPTERTQSDNTSQASLDTIDGAKVKFTDCFKFPLAYWLLCFTYGCYSNGIYTIQDFQQDYLVEEFEVTVDEANSIINTLVVIQVFIAIPFSLAVDKMGRNTLVAIVSISIAMLAHLLICLTVTPYISLGLLGISYSLMGSTVWPMFAYPLEKRHHGLGYGIASCFQSFSLTVCPMIAGKIIDGNGYFAAEYFYFATLTASFISIIAIRILDKKSNGILSMTASERKDFLKRDNNTSRNVT